MNRDELLALATRVEVLTAADICTAKAIFRAIHPDLVPLEIVNTGYGWREDSGGWWLATGEDARTPPKTIYPPKWLSSLDAAVTLVPVGAVWNAGNDVVNWAHVWHDVKDYGGVPYSGRASTPALALTAAALRAIAAQEVLRRD